MTRRWRYYFVLVIALVVTTSTPLQVAAEPIDLNLFDYDFFERNTVRLYDPNSQGACIPLDAGDANATSIVVGSDFSLGDDNSLRPVNLLAALAKDYDLEPHQAAGIVGNFMWESGGTHVPPDVNEGKAPGPPLFAGGYGWAQWTGGRQVAFIDYAIKKELMKSKNVNATDAANYAYLNYELTETSERAVIPAIRKARDVNQAAAIWEDVFERAGVVALSGRQKNARDVLDAYKNNRGVDGVDSSIASGDSSAINNCVTRGGGTASSVKFGNVTFPLEGNKSVVNNPDIFTNNTTGQGGHEYIAYDIYANAGTKVVAFAPGVVTRISSDICGSRLVTVYNKDVDIALSYMHMTTRGTPKVGTNLDPGDQIGFVASVNSYPCVNVDHLHIDAIKGTIRKPCARGGCAESISKLFVDIGPDLYRTYQELGG